MFNVRNSARRVFVAGSVAVLTFVGLVQPARAFPPGGPPGCRTIVAGIPGSAVRWDSTCWVGAGYSPYSELTSGVQALLIRRGYYYGPWDKVFGPGTRDALVEFQRSNGLVGDGVVGTSTWAKIFQTVVNQPSQCGTDFLGTFCDYVLVFGLGIYRLYLQNVGFVWYPVGVTDPSGRCRHWFATHLQFC